MLSKNLLCLGALAVSAPAFATLSGPLAINPNPSELAGFTNVFGAGNVAQSNRGLCYGCFDTVISPSSPLQGFAQINFQGGLWTGRRELYFVMSFNFPASATSQLQQLQASLQDSGVAAYDTTYNPYGNCSFAGFLSPSEFPVTDSLVMRFDIPPAPPSLVGDEVFTFAWDFTNPAWLGATPATIGFVPAPGALALIGLAGMARRRRAA